MREWRRSGGFRITTRDKTAWQAELEAQANAGRHHGRPGLPAAVKQMWIHRLATEIAEDQRRAAVAELASHPHPALRQVCAGLLAVWSPPQAWTTDTIRALAQDEDWEVREWAVAPFMALVMSPDGGPDLVQEWVDRGGRLRRAAILAARTWVLQGAWTASQGLDLADRVMDDADPYVQASVGSYYLGDGLLRRHRRETAGWLLERARRRGGSDAFWRNLVAMIRSAAARADDPPVLRPVVAALMEMGPPTREAQQLARWLDERRPHGST